MTTHTIRRVGVASIVKVVGLIYAGLGLIIGAVASLATMFGAAVGSMSGGEDAVAAGLVSAIFGIGAVIILPIVYGLLGAVVGLITALIYNLVAGITGGIKIELASLRASSSDVNQGAVSGL